MRLNTTAAHHFLKVYQLVFSEGPVVLVDTIHIYTIKLGNVTTETHNGRLLPHILWRFTSFYTFQDNGEVRDHRGTLTLGVFSQVLEVERSVLEKWRRSHSQTPYMVSGTGMGCMNTRLNEVVLLVCLTRKRVKCLNCLFCFFGISYK